ncbi:methyltransferase domain-containing protein [Kiritimatiellaeota bacterium B1221]|nr:methyltransferase domain-containing protein [Kiritimatiellaeota bacterium B1221]
MQFEVNQIQINEHPIQLAYAKDVPVAEEPQYWASLWPASLSLAEHVLDGNTLEGKRVLELGCGCGLAGIAAGMQGAEVTVTDLEPEALNLAQENWALNDLNPAAIEPLNWCAPDTDAQFDLILGADILYSQQDFPDLVRSINSLLDMEGSLVISEPGRPHAHNFFARMMAAGFRSETEHYPVSLHGECFEIGVSVFR